MFGGTFGELIGRAREHLPSLAQWTETQAEVHGAHMTFDGMPATAAWKLAEFLRVSIGPAMTVVVRALDSKKEDDGSGFTPELAGALMAGLQALPQAAVDKIAAAVTPYIRYRTDAGGTRKVGDISGFDAAFQDLPPGRRWLAIYESIFRAVAVNLVPPFPETGTGLGE